MGVMTVLVGEFSADVAIVDKEAHTAISYCLDFIGDRERENSHKDRDTEKDSAGDAKEDRFLMAALCLIEHGADPNYAGASARRRLPRICDSRWRRLCVPRHVSVVRGRERESVRDVSVLEHVRFCRGLFTVSSIVC